MNANTKAYIEALLANEYLIKQASERRSRNRSEDTEEYVDPDFELPRKINVGKSLNIGSLLGVLAGLTLGVVFGDKIKGGLGHLLPKASGGGNAPPAPPPADAAAPPALPPTGTDEPIPDDDYTWVS
jgi:hypothetical protein